MMENNSFQYPGFDYAAQQTKIDRRKALIQAMQQQALDPMATNQSVGGWAIPISPFQGAAQLAKAYYAGSGQKKLEQQQNDLSTKAQADYRAALVKGLGSAGVPNESIESIAALGSNPMTQGLIPTAVSYAQQQRMMKMLPQYLAQMTGQGGQQASPQVGQGTVLAPGAGQAPQGMPQGAGNLPAGSNMILASSLMGMPGLGKIGEHQFEQSRPIVQREGGLTDWQGNQITPPLPKAPEGFQLKRTGDGYELNQMAGANLIPGFKGQEAGAVSKAQMENSLHPVTQASGAVVPTLGSQIMQPPARNPQPIPRQQIGPQQRPIVPAGPQPIIPPDPGAVQVRPMGGGGGVNPVPIGNQRNSFSGPIGDPWQTMPRMQTPQGVGQSTYQKHTAENSAAVAKGLTEKYSQSATDSNQRKAFNDQALSLVDAADTGPLAARQADVKSILIKLVPGLTENSFKNTPSATIALNKDLINAATQKAKQQFGARITESEVNLMLQKASPNVDMPKAAIKYLLASDNAQLGYQLQQANDLNRFIKQGGDPTQFEAWYAKSFPMTNALRDMHMGIEKNPDGTQTAGPKVIDWNQLGR